MKAPLFILILLSAVTYSSCQQHPYYVNQEFIESSLPIEGFTIEKITVKKVSDGKDKKVFTVYGPLYVRENFNEHYFPDICDDSTREVMLATYESEKDIRDKFKDTTMFKVLSHVQKSSEKNIPILYESIADTLVRLWIYTHVTDTAKQVINEDTIILYSGKTPRNFTPQKRIYFNKSNEGYYWTISGVKTPKGKYSHLPLKFINGQWYHIHSLLGPGGEYSYHIFFQVQEDGSFTSYYQDRPGPF